MFDFIMEAFQGYTQTFMYVTDSATWSRIPTLPENVQGIYRMKAFAAILVLVLAPIVAFGGIMVSGLFTYSVTNRAFGKRGKESLEVVATDFTPAGPAINKETGRAYHRNATWLVSVKSPCGTIHSMRASEALFKTAEETGTLTMNVLRGAFCKKLLHCSA